MNPVLQGFLFGLGCGLGVGAVIVVAPISIALIVAIFHEDDGR